MDERDRIVDILNQLNPKTEEQSNDLPKNVKKINEQYKEDYWRLQGVQNNVFVFIVNTEIENINNAKMYIIPNYDFKHEDDKNYYSIITIAYNIEKRKTVSNYMVDHGDNILNNFQIDIDELMDEIFIDQETHITENQNKYIADLLSANINIIKNSCKNRDVLFEVIHELLNQITYEYDHNNDDIQISSIPEEYDDEYDDEDEDD
jgi:hypothetical protein